MTYKECLHAFLRPIVSSINIIQCVITESTAAVVCIYEFWDVFLIFFQASSSRLQQAYGGALQWFLARINGPTPRRGSECTLGDIQGINGMTRQQSSDGTLRPTRQGDLYTVGGSECTLVDLQRTTMTMSRMMHRLRPLMKEVCLLIFIVMNATDQRRR